MHNLTQLRDYQTEASQWMRAANNGHNILALDTGLGKTPTAIDAAEPPVLVVTRAHLVHQWYNALIESTNRYTVSMPEGTRLNRTIELRKPADVTVINYEMLRSYDVPEHRTIILDEAQRIRHQSAKHSERAVQLCWKAKRAHLLTATPYYRGDEDIYNLLRAVGAQGLRGYWAFLRQWFTVNWHAPYTPKIYGIAKSKRMEWDAYVSQYMLLRTYEDVGRTRPTTIDHVLVFPLPQALRPHYIKLKRDWQLLGSPLESVGSVYATLRQLTMCHTKVDMVKDIVSDIGNDTALIFTWYKQSAYTLAEALRRYRPLVLTGDTDALARGKQIAQQKRTGKPQVIIADIAALESGSNMEHVRHVIYAEETYVRGEHTQTLDRVRRDRNDSTDTRPVHVYYLRAKNTVDEAIPRIRESRGKMADFRSELAKELHHE